MTSLIKVMDEVRAGKRREIEAIYRQLGEIELHIGDFSGIYTELLDKLSNLEFTRIAPCASDLTLNFTGKKEGLLQIWKVLRQLGFTCLNNPPTGKNPGWAGFFHHENGAAVYLTFSSTVCKRVQTGTAFRTVQEPVYETVCEDTEDLSGVS